jgi:hypothetical protein
VITAADFIIFNLIVLAASDYSAPFVVSMLPVARRSPGALEPAAGSREA